MQLPKPSLAMNPFATRYVRPGKLPWLSGPEQSLEQLEASFTSEFGSRAAIIGSHGTGKSTLLAHLVPRLGNVVYQDSFGLLAKPKLPPVSARPARSIVWLSLRRGNSPLRRIWASRGYWSRGGLLVLDGFEQLNLAVQLSLIGITSLSRMGILVTAHARTALDTLIETNCSITLVQEIVASCFQQAASKPPAEFLDEELLQRLLSEEGGNLREVLMRLYDIAAEGLPTTRTVGKVD